VLGRDARPVAVHAAALRAICSVFFVVHRVPT
jgi:hypothetical protein